MLPLLFFNYLAFWAQSVDILAHIATPDRPQYKNISAPFTSKITVSVEHPRQNNIMYEVDLATQ